MLFVGIDWAEDHHDVCVLDVEGGVVARGRVPDGVEGVAGVHELIGVGIGGDQEPEVVVGIEVDRGLLVKPPMVKPVRPSLRPRPATYSIAPSGLSTEKRASSLCAAGSSAGTTGSSGSSSSTGYETDGC